MKKILVAVILIAAIIVSIYIAKIKPEPTPINITDGNNLDYITVDRDMTIAQNLCKERNLDDKIIIMESKYCSACRIAVPLLREIEEELGKEFIFLDLSEQEDAEKLQKHKIIPKYTPTVLVGCKVFVGVESKQEYETAIKDFYNM